MHEGSDNDDDTVNCCTLLATETVGDVRGEEEDEETSETGHGAEDAETTSFGVVEDYMILVGMRILGYSVHTILP